MNDIDTELIGKLLRRSIAPIGEQDMRFDLWTKMQSRLEHSSIRVPWFDWVLAAIVVIVCILIPETIAGLLFHL